MKPSIKKTRGMTLVEILVVVTLAVALLGAGTSFYVEAMAGQIIVKQRIDQAMDVRRFSQELIHNASRANQLFLYRSQKTAADWNSPADQLTIAGGLHPAGDFVVFVFYEFPRPSGQPYHRISKIIGYYLDATGGQIGPIKRVTIDLTRNLTTRVATPSDLVPSYDTTNSRTVVEQVLVNNWTNAVHTRFDTFALYARGLFEAEDVAEGFGRLFYLRDAQRSMMAAGQTYARQYTSDKRTYTDTFNFSITPRS